MDENTAVKATGVSYRECWDHDLWRGTVNQLISAGLIERHMIPGQPGRNKYSVTLNGGPNQYTKRDESYMQILRQGENRLIIKKGISQEEKDRRVAARILERERRRAAAPTLPENTHEPLRPEPRFQIGETVKLYDGSGPAKITDVTWHQHPVDMRGNHLAACYVYTVESTPSQKRLRYTEISLFKYVPQCATVLRLPTALNTPVEQERRRGRHPKSVTRLSESHRLRDKRDQRLQQRTKIEEAIRRAQQAIDYSQEKLARLKCEQQELLRQN